MKQENDSNHFSAECVPLRSYRQKLVSEGQASPLILGENVVGIIRKIFVDTLNLSKNLSILDIGCGLGHQMESIKSKLPNLFSRVEGLDWSPATVEKHNNDPGEIYNKVVLCSSDKIPYKDQEFDIALSMENLEHLYQEAVISALQEMKRIAKYIIITTPHPLACINKDWLYREMAEAILDSTPISQREFICLESAVHKSTLFPTSMQEAGFMFINNNQGQVFYIGESCQVDLSKIRYIGISSAHSPNSAAANDVDHKELYLKLIAQSAQLGDVITSTSTSQ